MVSIVSDAQLRRRGKGIYLLPKVFFVPAPEDLKYVIAGMARNFGATQAELGLAIFEAAAKSPAWTLTALLRHRELPGADQVRHAS